MCINIKTGMPEPCRKVEPYVPPGGFTPSIEPAELPAEAITVIPGRIRKVPGIKPTAIPETAFDEFETLVPGISPVPEYPTGIPTKVQVPGVTPSLEPGFAPEFLPETEFVAEEIECPDIPDLTDEDYCSQFPQCCEDVPEEGEIPVEEQSTSVWDVEGI